MGGIKWELYLGDWINEPWATPEDIEAAKRKYCAYQPYVPDGTERESTLATGLMPPDDDTYADGWRDYAGSQPKD